MARASQDTERLSIKDSPASDSSTAGGNIMAEVDKPSSESALRDNIERKGKNAYYYAHSHRATGPQVGRETRAQASRSDENLLYHQVVWLHPSTLINPLSQATPSSTRARRCGCTSTSKALAKKCSADDSDSAAAAVDLDWSENAMSLTISNYPTEGITRCLSFGRLYGKVERGTVKTKKDRVVVTLVKKKPKEEEKIEVSSENQEDGPW